MKPLPSEPEEILEAAIETKADIENLLRMYTRSYGKLDSDLLCDTQAQMKQLLEVWKAYHPRVSEKLSILDRATTISGKFYYPPWMGSELSAVHVFFQRFHNCYECTSRYGILKQDWATLMYEVNHFIHDGRIQLAGALVALARNPSDSNMCRDLIILAYRLARNKLDDLINRLTNHVKGIEK